MSDRHGGEGGANYARIRKQVQEATAGNVNVAREEEGSTRARRAIRAARGAYLDVGVADPSRTFSRT